MNKEKMKRKWFFHPADWCLHQGFWSGVTVFWAHNRKYSCEEAEPKLTKYKIR
jgi:hypothetical protein